MPTAAPKTRSIPILLPFGGVVENAGLSEQPPGTSPQAQNTRSYEPGTDRHRLSQRQGISRFVNDRVNGDFPIQRIHSVSQVLDPRRVVEDVLLMEDLFDGDNGTNITNPNTGRGLDHGYVEFEDEDTVAAGDVPGALTTNTGTVDPVPGDDRIITIQSNQMSIDTSAWAQDTNYARAVRLVGPDNLNELDFTRKYVIEVDITTIVASGDDQADDAQYWMGVWLRGRPDTTKQYLFLGIVREAGTSQMQVHLSEFDDMLNPVRKSIDIAPMDAGVHKLQIYVNRNYLECWLDGTQYVRTDISGLTAYSDGLGDHHWGLCFIRHRTAGAWTTTAHTPLFNNLRLYSGTESASRRQHKVVVVSDGDVKVLDNFRRTWGDPGGTMPAFDSNIRKVQCVELFQKIYWASGDDYKVYNANTNNVADWNGTGTSDTRPTLADPPESGELPGGDGKYGLNGARDFDGYARCPLINKFRGAIYLAGKADEPFNVFKCVNGDPEDWVYGGPDPGDAVAFNNSPVGEIGDAVRCLLPLHESRMGFLCDKSFYALTGDPATDGELVKISGEVGGVGPDCACIGEGRNVFWMSKIGLHVMSPNAFNIDRTNRVSENRLDKTLRELDHNLNDVELQWDEFRRGVSIFVQPRNGDPVFGWFWDVRDNAFHPDFFPENIGPMTSYVFNSDNLADRVMLLGGEDGRVRMWDDSAMWDDGEPIDSFIDVPLVTGSTQGFDIRTTRLDLLLGEQTTSVKIDVSGHRDPVKLLNGAGRMFTVTLAGPGGHTISRRSIGSALWMRIRSNQTNDVPKQRWSLESAKMDLLPGGTVKGKSW